MRVLALTAALVATVGFAACGSSPRVHPAGWGSAPRGLVALPRPASTRSAEMFDTVTLSTVPHRPFALAGYTSGFWPTYLPLRRAYPGVHTVSVAVSASHHADCLDVEPGDASPSQAVSWVRRDIAAGFSRPCLYSDLSNMPAIKVRLASALGSGWRSRVFLWLAWYRYVPGLVVGYDAVQWSDHALGRNLDESSVSLSFLAIASPPYMPPKPPAPSPSGVRIAYLRSLARKHRCYRRGPKPHACAVWGHEVKELE